MGFFSGLGALVGSAGADIIKARGSTSLMDQRLEMGRGPGKAVVSDPHVWVFAGGNYVEKPHAMGYNVLRYLANRDPLLSSIVLTRLRQVRSFAQVRTHDETERSVGKGFRVRMKEGNAKARTKAVTKREDEINNVVINCGRPDIKDRRERNLATFMWRFCGDRLTLDQACAEKQLDNKGELVQFFAIDGGTVRLVDPASPERKNAAFVQVYQQRVIAKFEEEELAFCPENLSTALDRCGYGMGEIEFAIRPVLTHLGIEAVNERMFHPGAMPKGLLWAKNAELSDEQMRALEHRWRAQVSNLKGRHKIPMLSVPRGGELNFINFPQPTEMEYAKFLDYLVNLLTSLYGMDPVEINFPNRGGVGMSGGQLSSANEEARLVASKDKGLRPMLSWFESCMNIDIVPYIDTSDEFEFSFVGFDPQTDKEKADLAKVQAETFKFVNEVRKEHGMDEREDCDIILNSNWLQNKQAADAAEQQAMGSENSDGNDENDVGDVDSNDSIDNNTGDNAQDEAEEWQKWQKSKSGQEGW